MSKPANWDPTYGEMLALTSTLGAGVSGDVSGAIPGPTTVTGIQSSPVSATPPATGQTLVWNGSEYVPQAVGVQFAATIGDGVNTSYTLTHGLGTLDVEVQVVRVADGATVWCSVKRPSTSSVTIGFAVAPATNTYRVLCSGS